MISSGRFKIKNFSYTFLVSLIDLFHTGPFLNPIVS